MSPQTVWTIVATVVCAAVGLSVGVSVWLLMPDHRARQTSRPDN